MDKDRVVSILKALAAGIDPQTGAPLAGAYQHVDTVRALYAALDILQERPPVVLATSAPATPPASAKAASARSAARAAPRTNSGKPWAQEEDERLLAAFDAGRPTPQIASDHGRSRMAIEARLARFGRMPMPAGVRQREAAVTPDASSTAGSGTTASPAADPQPLPAAASAAIATAEQATAHSAREPRRRYGRDTRH